MRKVFLSEWSNGCPYAKGAWIALPSLKQVSGLFLIDTGAIHPWIDEDIARSELGLGPAGVESSFGSDGEQRRFVFSVRLVLNADPYPFLIPSIPATGRPGLSASFARSPHPPPERVIGAIGMSVIHHGNLTVRRGVVELDFP